jgi:hypothetical protein
MGKNIVEEELNATRIKLYEATKGMTEVEKKAYYRSLVEPVYEKYGIKPIARAPQRPLKTIMENSK